MNLNWKKGLYSNDIDASINDIQVYLSIGTNKMYGIQLSDGSIVGLAGLKNFYVN